MAKGDWLDMGGVTAHRYGGAPLEVRVSNDGATWRWQALHDDQVVALLKFMNEHPGIRDSILSMHHAI